MSNFSTNNFYLKKIVIFFLLLLISYYIFFFLSSNVSVIDFDAAVYFTILEKFITTNHALIPIVLDDNSFICNKNFDCFFGHPPYFDGELSAQFPPEFTSGTYLFVLPKFIDNFVSIFFNPSYTLFYFIKIYSLGASLIFFGINFILLSFKKLSYIDLIRYFLISFLSVHFILVLTSYSAIGELYSSFFILPVAISLFFLDSVIKNKTLYFILLSFFLGFALECKLSSLFTVITLLIIICINFDRRNLFKLVIILFFFTLPKLLILLYYLILMNFNFESFFNFIYSYYLNINYNAGAGINWANTTILKQINYLNTHNEFPNIFYFFIFYLIFSIILFVKSNNNKPIIISLIITSTLIYPIIFKFPYLRIFSYFVALFPLILISFKYINLGKNKLLLIGELFFFLFFYFYFYNLPIIQSINNRSYEKIDVSYPNITFPNKNNIFITNHFFSFPWDIYLDNNLNKSGPLFNFPIYSSYSISKTKFNNDFNFFLIYSCRWGHCPKDNYVEWVINQNNNKCELIKPKINSIYKIYKCDIK